MPEDSALLFDTPEGVAILTGCGHAGVINIVEYARHLQGARPLIAIVGGIHLFAATDAELLVAAAGSSFFCSWHARYLTESSI